MNKRYLVLGLILFLFSCETKTEPQVCNPPSQISFEKDIQPIFNTNCISSGCHSGGSPQGNLSLESGASYSALWKPGAGYVDTINPKSSLLYAQMNSTSNPMPPSGRLDDCKLELIRLWMEQKAKNN